MSLTQNVNQMLRHRETYDVSCTECKSDAETGRRIMSLAQNVNQMLRHRETYDVSCTECKSDAETQGNV